MFKLKIGRGVATVLRACWIAIFKSGTPLPLRALMFTTGTPVLIANFTALTCWLVAFATSTIFKAKTTLKPKSEIWEYSNKCRLRLEASKTMTTTSG